MKASEPQPKRQYQPPKLHIYGDLAQLTRSLGNMGQNDGPGKGTKHKTGV
jgi:hypothetical protein